MNKATITINFEKDSNGVVSMSHNIESDGYHMYELVGLIDMVKHSIIKVSHERAVKLTKDELRKLDEQGK